MGRAQAARRLDEAHKLLDEVNNMLAEMRRTTRWASAPRHLAAGDERPQGAESNVLTVDEAPLISLGMARLPELMQRIKGSQSDMAESTCQG